MAARAVKNVDVAVERLGTVLEPNGDPTEARGVFNPASARTRDGTLLIYPRDVARGNVSRVGRVRAKPNGGGFEVERMGFAIEPSLDYEKRGRSQYGCEDPRVTYVAALERYVMMYTAVGPEGPRIAIALSEDGYDWERMGLMHFDKPGMAIGDDKDAAFFPEPVRSPRGVESLAFYHRPMLHLSAVAGRAAVPMIQRMPFEDRESIRLAYVPLKPVLSDLSKILDVHESVLVMSPDERWGSLKIGAGTPPVRVAEGWLSLFHGVDVVEKKRAKLEYCAGIMIGDARAPHRVVYRSPKPVLRPETPAERGGIVENVVFPTGIDPRPDLGEGTFDVYYGMADYRVGAARIHLK
jgi:beta-1,2-mannobiose phosphorylase / 1,2-beta-oligomannan phosphorylase